MNYNEYVKIIEIPCDSGKVTIFKYSEDKPYIDGSSDTPGTFGYILKQVINQYVEENEYNEFFEIQCLTPWLRIITTDLNKFDYKLYDDERLIHI